MCVCHNFYDVFFDVDGFCSPSSLAGDERRFWK